MEWNKKKIIKDAIPASIIVLERLGSDIYDIVDGNTKHMSIGLAVVTMLLMKDRIIIKTEKERKDE